MRTKKSNFVIPLLSVLFGVFVATIAMDLGLLPWRRHYNPGIKNACIANLKQIDGAKATWAEENKKTSTDIPTATDLYGATAYIREEPLCPQGGKYVIGNMRQKPRCSVLGHAL